MIKRRSLFLTILLLPFMSLSAQKAPSVTGVDSSSLLTRGLVDIYVSLNEPEKGALPEADQFFLEEKTGSAASWTQGRINDVQYNGFRQDEISILLLLDNSGSMYDSLAGTPEDRKEFQRIYFVVQALQDLFSSTRDYQDRLSLLSFNTAIETVSGFTSNRNQLLDALGEIRRPDAAQAYTELYRAMETGADELGRRKGRKVLILLSDGENYTYAENKKEPHPLWGNKLIGLDEVETLLLQRGITLYTIQYARNEDGRLSDLSARTGGLSYKASSKNDLLRAYREIHDRINREFRISYKPEISASRDRQIRVSLADGGSSPSFAYSLELFWGLPPQLPWWIFALLTLLSIALVILIHKTPFERIYAFPHLEVISDFETGKTVIQIAQDKTMIAVGRQKTVVMDETEFAKRSADEAGLTVIKGADGSYRLEADQDVMVNNKTVTSKELEPGDVIRSEGTLIIFDKPEE